jgi:hypothetical protein
MRDENDLPFPEGHFLSEAKLDLGFFGHALVEVLQSLCRTGISFLEI